MFLKKTECSIMKDETKDRYTEEIKEKHTEF